MSTRKTLHCSELKTSGIMRGVHISPLAGPSETHKETQEIYNYDEVYFKHEAWEHENFDKSIAYWDLYTGQNEQNKYRYNIVAQEALEAKKEKKDHYVIENYSIEGKNLYFIKINFENLKSSLKNMRSLPSRLSMYIFLEDFYRELYEPTFRQSSAQYQHGNSDMVKIIWQQYYNIVDFFYMKNHDSKEFNIQKLAECVDRFVALLKSYKEVYDHKDDDNYHKQVYNHGNNHKKSVYHPNYYDDDYDDDDDDDNDGQHGNVAWQR
jgi:hypothetical protein